MWKAGYVSRLKSRKGQGRPLGFLMAWLRAGHSVRTGKLHHALEITYDMRKAGRDELLALEDTAKVQALLAAEKGGVGEPLEGEQI